MSSQPRQGVPQKPTLALLPGLGDLRQKYPDVASSPWSQGGLRRHSGECSPDRYRADCPEGERGGGVEPLFQNR